jgi:hypothetical protein
VRSIQTCPKHRGSDGAIVSIACANACCAVRTITAAAPLQAWRTRCVVTQQHGRQHLLHQRESSRQHTQAPPAPMCGRHRHRQSAFLTGPQRLRLRHPQWLRLRHPQWLRLRHPQWLRLRHPQWLRLRQRPLHLHLGSVDASRRCQAAATRSNVDSWPCTPTAARSACSTTQRVIMPCAGFTESSIRRPCTSPGDPMHTGRKPLCAYHAGTR